MMSKEKRWSKSFGPYGRTIRVAEREPGGVLYLHWIDKSGKQRKRSLGHRDRERGEREAAYLSERLAREMEMLSQPNGTALPRSITVGEVAGLVTPPLMAGVTATESVAIQADVTSSAEQVTKPLTISEGIELAFDSDHGHFPTESRHKRESRRALDRLAARLPDDLTWEKLDLDQVTAQIRKAARASVDGSGYRATELTWEMMYTVAQWLRDRKHIPLTAAVPRLKWKENLKREWEAITGHKVEPYQPRYTEEEAARLLAAAHKVDPRLELLLEIGVELRCGQVLRCRRSDLELEGGGFGLGRVQVHGKGRKAGEVVDLHPEARECIDFALSEGYLADAEAAYREGKIKDYFLFPGGRLRRGRARVDNAAKLHIHRRTLNDWIRELEVIAGVEYVPRRALYGLRRFATDLAEDFEKDDRVLNLLSGHLDSKTRRRIYQQRDRDKLRARAAITRRQMRHYLSDITPEA